MGLKLYLFGLYSTFLVSLGLLLLLLFNVNPFNAPFWIIIIFYLSLFFVLVAIFAILGFYLKLHFTNHEVIFGHLIPTLRQAMIFSLILVGLLFLQQMKVLSWWIAGLFILAIGMIELFFRSKK